MYYIYTDPLYAYSMKRLIHQLLKLDKKEDTPFPNSPDNNSYFFHDCPPKKRRKYSTWILKVTPQMLCDNMNVSLGETSNSIDSNTSLYHKFKEQLVLEGKIQWRQHNDFQDTVIMSDYSPDTGSLKLLSYVHVTCKNIENGQNFLIQCTCPIYNTIKCAGLAKIDLAEDEEAVLDESLTCMHCRFYREHLDQYRHNLHHLTSTDHISQQIKDSLTNLNNPVVLLGTPISTGTSKFSVITDQSMAIVHINFKDEKSCFANCQNGECTSQFLNKNKIPKCCTLQDHDKVCIHLQTLFGNFEILERTFPFHFRNDSSRDSEVDNRDYTQELHDMQPLNTDDMCIDENVQHNSNFNTASGLWDFGGKSDHKPKEMNDLKLSWYCIFVNNNNYDL